MYKKLFFLFLFILIINFTGAAEIELNEEVLKGETLIAKISGNFVKQPIEENIKFYRRHMSTSMGFYDFIEIDGDYYVYVNIPLEKEADNYSIVISGVEYYSGTSIINNDIIGNFTIFDKQASFSLNPGILLSNKSYTIKIQNLIGTSIDIIYEKLTKEEVEEIVEEDEPSFFESLFGNIKKQNKTEEISGETINLKSGEKKEINIPVGNYTGFERTKFIYQNESYYVMAYIYGIEEIIEKNKTKENKTNITIEENETEIIGNITIKNKTKTIDNGPEIEDCNFLGGIICEEGEKCEGETKYSATDICCIGKCIKKEKNNTGKIIGWIIIIFLALFLTWFLKNKYKKAGPKSINLEEEAKPKRQLPQR